MKQTLNIFIMIAYGLLVALVSLQPLESASIGSYDKVGHFLVYGIFALLAFRVEQSRKHYLYLCVAIVAYGGLMEFGQSFVPGRYMSALDMVANTAGVVLGMALCEFRLRSSRNNA